MSSMVDVFNVALGHCGISTLIADPDERSSERLICSRFWPMSVAAVFSYRSVAWRFALRTRALTPISQNALLGEFIYAYPDKCATIQAVKHSPEATEHLNYEVVYEESFRAIKTVTSQAYAVYVELVEQVERWPESFAEAVAYRLAANIAVPIKASDADRNNLLALSEQAIQIAAAHSLNEAVIELPVPSIYEQVQRNG